MTKDEYIKKFDKAVKACLEFGQQFVIEDLPSNIKFDIFWNQIDKKSGKIKFHGGRLFEPNELKSMNYIQARKMLWIDGKVPHWVNLSVTRIEGTFTVIEMMLCHKLATTEQQNQHLKEGIRPFRIRGPRLPSGWKSFEENGKFSLGRCRTEDERRQYHRYTHHRRRLLHQKSPYMNVDITSFQHLSNSNQQHGYHSTKNNN